MCNNVRAGTRVPNQPRVTDNVCARGRPRGRRGQPASQPRRRYAGSAMCRGICARCTNEMRNFIGDSWYTRCHSADRNLLRARAWRTLMVSVAVVVVSAWRRVADDRARALLSNMSNVRRSGALCNVIHCAITCTLASVATAAAAAPIDLMKLVAQTRTRIREGARARKRRINNALRA